MSDLLNAYDLSRKKTAVLQNAFSITETQELNKIYSLDFSLPSADEKIKFIQPFHYVRFGNNGQLYRIIKSELDDGGTGTLKVSCEHVIGTLCDDIMFRSHQYGGGSIKTGAVIEWLLSKQSIKNWKLGTCDFDRKFEYLWEEENLLNALYAIPKEFSKSYQWVFDTVSYPWTVSLKTIDETIPPEYYIRAKKNLLGSESSQDFTDICTRIYPLGYGEGVNQLTIEEATVTNIHYDSNHKPINATPSDTSTAKYGNTYIQSPASITNVYGIKEKVLVDRRYENANSLFSYAKTMLESMQTPSMSRSFDVVDLYPITSENIDNAEVGKICKMTGDGSIAYITKTTRVLDDPGNLSIELSTKATDVASTIADLADRVRIESVYAQGATQLYQHSKDANASPEKGSVLNLYFPEEMKQINKVLLKVQLDHFRSYSQTTADGGDTVQTSINSGGGGISLGAVSVDVDVDVTVESTSQANWTNPSNLGVNTSRININDWSYETSVEIYNTSHTHPISYGGYVSYATPSGSEHTHTHYLNDGDSPNTYINIGEATWGGGPYLSDDTGHRHVVDKRDLQHTHSAEGTGHGTGNVPVNNTESGQSGFSHSHTVNLPPHHHDIIPGIFEASYGATGFSIYVNGILKTTFNNTSWDGDITEWLLTDKRQVPRNSWIKIEIRPNQLAYVISSVFVQGFVQSRGGGNY